ncbi:MULTISPECIES: hypothetical protein [Methylobacterium]|uniref:DUF1508 domain-containing protein n=1 Tax=Methylobacterium longum TaxID=767694 RepID=A0ABT8AP60_9HYPH|nr:MULTISPECIES: hypothetical protein [Methylobacterium]MCJ2103573.1 hypothetical protein [Methylobacterium sp. E-046]MDN3571346.1 hypothetical protein [Methylobacterium longum]GJE09201.1 hypothetical protein FOHLNKBM_0223 [Methylobacterium longum]
MHFQIRQDGKRWSWVLLSDAHEPIAASDQAYPSAAQASAAALAFAHLVARAGRSLTVTPSGPLL